MIRSSADATFTTALEEFDREKYRDRWSFDPLLKSDPNWWPEAKARIHQCRAALWIVSAASVKSMPCHREAQYALRVRRPLMLWYIDRARAPGFALGYALRVAAPGVEMSHGLASLHQALAGRPTS